MKTRFYYSLTRKKQGNPHETKDEFGIELTKENPLIPGDYQFYPYYPIANEKGIHWLISALTGYDFGEDPEGDWDALLLKNIWLNFYNKEVG